MQEPAGDLASFDVDEEERLINPRRGGEGGGPGLPVPGIGAPVTWQREELPPPGSCPKTAYLPSYVKAAVWPTVTPRGITM